MTGTPWHGLLQVEIGVGDIPLPRLVGIKETLGTNHCILWKYCEKDEGHDARKEGKKAFHEQKTYIYFFNMNIFHFL